jgi:glutathione peroxidase
MTYQADRPSLHPQHDNHLYHQELELISGESLKLSDYRDHVILIINTASRCGFTPQYKELEELHQEYHQHGLILIGCPCDQFGGQELTTDEEIQSFCQLNFNVSFPLTKKLKVNGPHAHPLFKELKRQATGLLGTQSIKWNFTKFLLAPNATHIKRYGSRHTPKSIEKDIRKLLKIT